MRKFWYTLLLLAGLAGSLAFLCVVWWQHHAITQFTPVPARIAFTDLITHRGSKSTTYEPKIDYLFTYKDQNYTSSQILPYGESGDYYWAKNIIDHFPEHTDATAYIDPDNPKDSILWRVHSGTPYIILIVFNLVTFLALFLLTRVLAGSRSTMLAIPMDADGRFLLLPQKELRKLRRDRTLLLFALLLAACLPWSHFMLVTEEHRFAAWCTTVILAIISVIMAMQTARAWSNARHLSDARLIVSPAPLPTTGTLDLQVEIDAYQPLTVNALTATLVCVETRVTGSGRNRSVKHTDILTKTATLAQKTTIKPGELLSGAASLSLAGEPAYPSWDGKKKDYPYWTWELRITADLEGTADYAAIFPLLVQESKPIDAAAAT